jgi:eukaryotic-like serine/threonine-protein kinase
MPLQQGQIIHNRYRIVKLLGQGGYGAVYRAWDLSLNGPCALKENTETSPEAEQQFAREASILANLQHPNLPRVRDHFILKGQGQYLVMDFIQGEDLQARLQRTCTPLPEDQALEWIGQVADALSYLHKQNLPVIHRDIKPANIVITPDNRAMLVDFGISKIFAQGKKTALGAQAVTPGYSPPEQYGQASTDARTDIYALGATLYTLLTAQEPPDSLNRTPHDILLPVRTVNPQAALAVEQAITQAMALHPDQRFQTVAQFKLALARAPAPSPKPVPSPLPPTAIVQSPKPPLAPVPPSSPSPAVRRDFSKLFWTLGTVIGLVALGALAYWGLMSLTPLGPQVVEFQVQADKVWQATGVILEVGDSVTVEYIDGQWSTAPDWDLTGLYGYPGHPSANFTLPYAELMILIGKIGDTPPFIVTGQMDFAASYDGELWLAANDDNYWDNSGSITVKITAPPR